MSESTIKAELLAAGARADMKVRKEKKNYAERLSRGLAQKVANSLRQNFPTVLPNAAGGGQESKARTSKGFKKLDVNYSTPELGLGLGVSVKTINFPDGASGRFTKNFTRVDAELRAEASDYHDRQPYAVMVAVIFLPSEACDDGGANTPSSFGAAVRIFRFRAGRDEPQDSPVTFERIFIGYYDTADATFGDVRFVDVMDKPPRTGRPRKSKSWDEMTKAIVAAYDHRNSPPFEWEEGEVETVIAEPDVDDEEGD